MEDEDEKQLPVPAGPVVPERTPEGRFPKGMSGNPSGRPLNARTKFSKELIEAFAGHFSVHGAAAIQHCFEEQPSTYLSLAMKLIPQEVRVEAARALDEMPDSELIAVVVAAKRKQ
jgi:hypothetical protein